MKWNTTNLNTFDDNETKNIIAALVTALAVHIAIITSIDFTDFTDPALPSQHSLNISLIAQPGGEPRDHETTIGRPSLPTEPPLSTDAQDEPALIEPLPGHSQMYPSPSRSEPMGIETSSAEPITAELKTAEPLASISTGPASTGSESDPASASGDIATASDQVSYESSPTAESTPLRSEPITDFQPKPGEPRQSSPGRGFQQIDQTLPSVADLLTSGLQIARIQGKSSPRASNARERFFNPKSMTTAEKFYIQAWVRKVEQVGTLNFPEEARRRNITGKLTLDVA